MTPENAAGTAGQTTELTPENAALLTEYGIHLQRSPLTGHTLGNQPGVVFFTGFRRPVPSGPADSILFGLRGAGEHGDPALGPETGVKLDVEVLFAVLLRALRSLGGQFSGRPVGLRQRSRPTMERPVALRVKVELARRSGRHLAPHRSGGLLRWVAEVE